MATHCIFCGIAKKEVPEIHVYEDSDVIAFMDIKPISEGHTLIIPKKHYENIYEIPAEEAAHLFKVVKKVAYAVSKGMDAKGISIFQNNGRAAGQVVFHLHVHIVPRYGDEKACRPRERRQPSKLDAVADRIKQHI